MRVCARVHQSRECASKQGIAIVAALYFMTIIAVLAVAVLYSARQWTRTEDRAIRDAALSAAVEEGLVGLVSDWSSPDRAEQAVGSTVQIAPVRQSGLQVAAHITRLTQSVYWLQAEARGAGPFGARHRATLLVRVPEWQPPSRSPLLSAGDILLGTNTRILMDNDGFPACSDGGGDAAVTLAPDARMQLAAGYPVAERPVTRVDSAVASPLAVLAATGAPWEELVRHADIRLSPGSRVTPLPVVDANGCADTDHNWGEPLRQAPSSICERRWPVVYASGDLTLDGGRAQGVLLVEGRLRLAGPLLMSGLVVARGGIETVADGITITGIVISGATNSTRVGTEGGEPTPVSLRHATTLRFALCDAQHGMASTKRVQVVRERAWAELF
jgi:hypothetical protein